MAAARSNRVCAAPPAVRCIGNIHMRSALSASTIVCFLASASLATAQDLMPVVFTHVGLREAGVVAVQWMSSDPLQRQAFMAAQLQPTKLKSDRKTMIIVASVIAAAVVIYMIYQFEHSDWRVRSN